MSRPTITDIDTVLKIHYTYPEIGNKEIEAIFGKRSSATLARLKRDVQKAMIEEGVCAMELYKINTKIAYKAWGIDVADLEQRRNKLIKLGLYEKQAQ